MRAALAGAGQPRERRPPRSLARAPFGPPPPPPPLAMTKHKKVRKFAETKRLINPKELKSRIMKPADKKAREAEGVAREYNLQEDGMDDSD